MNRLEKTLHHQLQIAFMTQVYSLGMEAHRCVIPGGSVVVPLHEIASVIIRSFTLQSLHLTLLFPEEPSPISAELSVYEELQAGVLCRSKPGSEWAHENYVLFASLVFYPGKTLI